MHTPRQARLSPTSRVTGQKDGPQPPAAPSARSPWPAPSRSNPAHPAETAPFPGQTGRSEPRRRRPRPFALPPTLRKTRFRPAPPHPRPRSVTRRIPFQPLNSTPLNPILQHRRGPPLLQGDRNPLESLIGIAGTGDRNRRNAHDLRHLAPTSVSQPLSVATGDRYATAENLRPRGRSRRGTARASVVLADLTTFGHQGQLGQVLLQDSSIRRLARLSDPMIS